MSKQEMLGSEAELVVLESNARLDGSGQPVDSIDSVEETSFRATVDIDRSVLRPWKTHTVKNVRVHCEIAKRRCLHTGILR
jgi:hypothetical protein